MRVAELMLASLQQSRVYLEMRMDVCPPDGLLRRLPGSSLQSIAAIYAHAVITEEASVHDMLGREPLYQAPQWRRLGLPPQVWLDPAWAATFEPDVPALRSYASAVYDATDGYLTDRMDDSLEEQVTRHMARYEEGQGVIREVTVSRAMLLMDNVVLHTVEHAAEIGALLGVQGLKATPWG